jgi:hypothetical protein|tara:strand:+ start:702 stop:1355 length:654 start_codon:yes stop_codon:yes gene_type:complete
MSELVAIDDSIRNFEPIGGQTSQEQAAPHGLRVEFYMHPALDEKKSNEEGRPIYEELPYVMIMVPGDKSTVVRRPVRKGMHAKSDNNRFRNEYQAFLEKKTQPIQGTLLREWPQITRAQVMELEHLNIRTVENLAEMADGYAQQYMGLNSLKTKASKWLELTKAEAPMVMLQAALKEKDEQIASQGNAIEELQAMMIAMQKPKGKKAKKEEDDSSED